jgi:archaellum biogenesis ATPase FlaH/ribosomal protein S25
MDPISEGDNGVWGNAHEYDKAVVAWLKQEKEDAKPIQGMPLKELLSAEFPLIRFLVDGWLPAEGITLLTGNAGTFKTFIACHVAVQVACHGAVFDEFKTEKAGVLYIDEDNGGRRLKEVFTQLRAPEELPIHFWVKKGFTITDKWIEKVLTYTKEHKIGLVIIDSFFRVADVNENDAQAIGGIMKKLLQLRDAPLTVLLIHHNRKTGFMQDAASDIRGSSVFRDGVDSHVGLQRLETNPEDFEGFGKEVSVVFHHSKSRDGAELGPFVVRIKRGGDIATFTREPFVVGGKMKEKLRLAKEFVLRALQGKDIGLLAIATEATRQKLNLSASILKNALRNLEDDGFVGHRNGKSNKYLYYLIKTEGKGM